MKKTFCKEMAFSVALITNSLAISLLVHSVFGVSTLSSLPLVLSELIPSISFGMTNFIVQSILLCILMIITKQPKFSYLFSFIIAFVFGLLCDLFEVIVAPLPQNLLICRIVYFVLGWLLISFGAALFIKSCMPLMPFDEVVADLSRFLNVEVKKVKTTCDAIFVSSALLISFIFLHKLSGVGIGTIFMAFFTGSLTQFFLNYLDKTFEFKCFTEIGVKLEDIAKITPKSNKIAYHN